MTFLVYTESEAVLGMKTREVWLLSGETSEVAQKELINPQRLHRKILSCKEITGKEPPLLIHAEIIK
jgi:hypothetical protein